MCGSTRGSRQWPAAGWPPAGLSRLPSGLLGMQSACNQHAISMQSACNRHAIGMQSVCNAERTTAGRSHLPFGLLGTQSACNQHAIGMQWPVALTCHLGCLARNRHAISMQSACNGRSLSPAIWAAWHAWPRCVLAYLGRSRSCAGLIEQSRSPCRWRRPIA
jgi:hypothetical protein